MGNTLCVNYCNSCNWNGSRQDHHIPLLSTEDKEMLMVPLLMPDWWKERDDIYKKISRVREKLEERNLGRVLRTISKFVPCQVPSCKCKGWLHNGFVVDSYGWKNSTCIKSCCNHPLSDHISHIINVTMTEFITLLQLVFDIINIKGTLENESNKSKYERNVVLEEVFYTIYREMKHCIYQGSFMSFNIDQIYGTPPFETTKIIHILMNFCMYMFGDNNSELKNSLIITKFILRYFDTWVWITPKELPCVNSNQCLNKYHYYYRRYMVFCCLPRCVHSISQRYKMSSIFGRDVLKYTLKVFRMHLQNWCCTENKTWLNHTKLFCLERLPVYMNLLEEEVYADRSPIWNMSCKLSDFKNKIDSELNENNKQ